VLAPLPRLLADIGIEPRHLVHVGAHEAQEWPTYCTARLQRVTWVEPIPELAAALRTHFTGTPGVQVVECACSAAPGTAVLHVMEPTNVSTLLAPGLRDRVVRDVTVEVRTLADVAPDANIAVIDVQGAELEVMAGAPWDALDLMVVEACTVEDPTISAGLGDVLAEGRAHGFGEVARWGRDYAFIDRFARGPAPSGAVLPAGEVLDVALLRGAA
jgi:FkbM family methyltransferase